MNTFLDKPSRMRSLRVGLFCLSIAFAGGFSSPYAMADDKVISEAAFFDLAMHDGKNYSEDAEKKLMQGLGQGYSVNKQVGHRTVFMQMVHRAATPDLIKAALKNKPNLAIRDYTGRTPFMTAVAEKSLEIVELLWPSPFTGDLKDINGESLVTMAVNNPDERVLPRILKEKVHAGVKDSRGISPVMRIARGEVKVSPETLALLKERGADFNEVDPETGLTTLQALFIRGNDIRFGDEEKVKMLHFLKLGASPETRNKAGDTAFHAILRQSNGDFKWPFFMMLGTHPDLELKDANGATVLNALAGTARDEGARCELIWQLLSTGADINTTDNKGMTPLMAAADNASGRVIYELLLAGADTKAVSKEGLNVLFYGIFGHLYHASFNELIKFGADVGLRHAPTGMTPLLTALLDVSASDYTRYLIEAGADVNAADNEGRTPLMAAALRQDNGMLFDKLIQAGANIDAKDKHGKKAVDYLDLNPKMANPDERNQKNLADIRAKLTKKSDQVE